MPRSNKIGIALGLALAASGCWFDTHDEPVEIAGFYRVDRGIASAPCDMTPVDYQPRWPYLLVELDGPDYWLYGCNDAAGDQCFEPSPPVSFTFPIDDGWAGSFASAIPGGGACALRYVDHAAYAFSESSLEVDVVEYSENDFSGICTVEEADRRNTSMPCVGFERLEATRL